MARTASSRVPGCRADFAPETARNRSPFLLPQSLRKAVKPVVYVQVAGETFERRIVSRGTASGNLVAITGDVKPGERVVTVGAAAVRAAAATPDAFGHGHAH